MAIQGQGMYRQGLSGGPSQQGRPNYPGNYSNQYNTPVFNNSLQNNGYRRNNDQPYPPQYNSQQNYPNQRPSSFVPLTQPQAYTQAPCQTTPASDPILWRDLAINGENDEDELTRGRNSGLRQDERPTDDRQKG